MKIFVSRGRAYTPRHQEFVEALEAFLKRNGCQPHTIGSTVPTAIQPVQRARNEMRECDGAVILAFTRYHIPQAIEFPESDSPERLTDLRYPTVWNQLEAAMAYGLDLPLLILVERELTRQGMLSDRTEWFPQLIDIDPSLFEDDAFKGTFSDWKSFAEQHKANVEAASHKKTPADESVAKGSPAGEPIVRLLGRLTVGQLWSALAAFATVIGAAFALGFWVSKNFGGTPGP